MVRRIIIPTIILVFAIGCSGRNPALTRAEAEDLAGVFCLPSYLPAEINPDPVFYEDSFRDIPYVNVLYTRTHTSEGVFIIQMEDYTYSAYVKDGDFYPCATDEDKITLANGLRVCDDASRVDRYYERETLFQGSPLTSAMYWMVNRDGKWARYVLMSSLPFQETKKIAESMCTSE